MAVSDAAPGLFETVKELMLNNGGVVEFLAFVSCAIAFFAVEQFVPRRRTDNAKVKRWRTNVALTVLVMVSAPLIPVTFVSAAFWAKDNGYGIFNLVGDLLPVPVLFVLTLAVREFISYGTHYLHHKIPIIWRFHRVHHLDTDIDVSTTVRVHPIEMLIVVIIGLPIILLFGLSPWMLLFYQVLHTSVTLFSHANIRIPNSINRYLCYVLVTPNLHQVHHSSYRPETDSNFSAVFPPWDILFGTFRIETREPLETMRIGLDEFREPRVNGFWWLIVSPFIPDRLIRDRPGMEV